MTRPGRGSVVAVAIAIVLAVLVSACQPRHPFPPSPTGPPDTTAPSVEARLVEAMSADRVRHHLAALQRIADEHDGNRAAGTPGYQASVEHVRTTLEAVGYRVTLQEFPYTVGRVAAQTAEVVSGRGLDLTPVVMQESPDTVGPVTAAVTVPTQTLGCAASDYAAVRGTIVLVERGSCRLGEKSQLATEAGAVAVLIYDNDPQAEALHGTLAGTPRPGPTAGIPRAEGLALRDALAAGEVRLRVEFRTERVTGTSHNVIADWPGTSTEERVLMVGAHLDSVAEGPGINDNASGTALVLSLATVLAERDEASGLRLGFWGAEELGLVGSRHYVDGLSSGERERVAAYLNFDMVASPNGIIGGYGTGSLIAVLGDAFAAHDIELAETDLGGASDHAAFDAVGIPVAGIFTGAGGQKSAEQAKAYGGRGGEPYDSCYHRACDTLATVTTAEVTARLEVIGDAVVVAVRELLHRRG